MSVNGKDMDPGPAGGTSSNGKSRLDRRRRAVITTAAVAVGLSVGGVVAAQWVQSPSQALADTRPPKASVITAQVVRQVLRSTVVLRGTFSDGRTVSAAPTSVAATEASSQPAHLVVTGVYAHPGQRVQAAQVLVEYSGRPIIALAGALPAYRDLTFDEKGKDVTQLQAALRVLGYRTGGDAEGSYGPGTEAAVRRLYGKLGYPVPVSTADPAQPGDGRDPGAGTSGAAMSDTAPSAGPVTHAMLPASEVVFIPSLPARVVSVPVQLGDPIKGPVVTLASGGMTLTGQLDPSQSGLVAAGMPAQVLSEATGAEANGVVDSVGALVVPGAGISAGDGPDGAAEGAGEGGGAAAVLGGGAYLPLAIHPDNAWDNRFAGQDVRITITAAATDSAVLAVPQAAISARADTQTTVTVVNAGGAQRVVPVKAGVSADGLVQVTPLSGARLEPADRVVVGQ
jgi:peptidoglycan hydrolase-like protein with peptidoglycan-binding domain